jgi:hypothetical protein
MTDSKPHLHISHEQGSLVPATPVVPVERKASRVSGVLGKWSPLLLSQLLRILALLTTQCPHLFPFLVGQTKGQSIPGSVPWAGIVAPALYLYSLPGWLEALNPRYNLAGRSVSVKDDKVEVQEKSYAQAVKNRKGKKRIVKVEQIEEFQDVANPVSRYLKHTVSTKHNALI